jgi:hypothetical protein
MLLGITGYKRNGKDTITDILVRKYGYTKYSFAGIMKQCAHLIFGWSPQYIEECKEIVDPCWGISPREFLQYFGTEFGQRGLCEKFPLFKKNTGRELWARALMHLIERPNKAVIADVRFPHEAGVIREHGGKILRVFGGYPGCPKPDLSHESEYAVDDIEFDYVLVNDETVENLNFAVDAVMGMELYGL